MRKLITFFGLLIAIACTSQTTLAPLTVEKIMRDSKWIGASPSGVSWSYDSKYVYFNWNPEKAVTDSLYFISKENPVPQKTSYQQRESIIREREITYNNNR